MILLDTSGLLACLDAGDRAHDDSRAALERADGPYLLSPFVLAELEYLVRTRVATATARALVDEVGRGAYDLCEFSRPDVASCHRAMARYEGLALSLADASILVLAERTECRDILTLDQRDFRAVEGPGGRPFRILPADAPA